MTKTYNTSFSRKSPHFLTVIDTDIAESEGLVRQMAKEHQQANPDLFAGLQPSVYFKMPYIPPCDNFHELRRLILRIRDHTGLRADFKGIVAIEATQWLGHEREEYFTVLLKYLYDHRHNWHAAIILHDCKPAQLQRFTSACACYMTPNTVHIRMFENTQALCGKIRDTVEKSGSGITSAAASMLAAALARPELKDVRSLSLIERTVAELIAHSGQQAQVSKDHVRSYLRDHNTTPAMVAGKPLCEERSKNHEHDLLHL